MTIIDVAGGSSGGAARWREEARAWVEANPGTDVRLVGLETRLSPGWLLRRELGGRDVRRIAANNVGYITGKGPKIVLLRNALHFLLPGERNELPGLPHGMEQQSRVVRFACSRADKIVVPSAAMAERVMQMFPAARDRLLIRHHPVTTVAHRSPSTGDRFILFPIVPAAHKDLVGSVRQLVKAVQASDAHVQIMVTVQPEQLAELANSPYVRAVGLQTVTEISALYQKASAVYLPSSVESFGYPVAEARAMGLPVVAISSPQNVEIGGAALFGFQHGNEDSLCSAVWESLKSDVTPDPTPFDADNYFRWLTEIY